MIRNKLLTISTLSLAFGFCGVALAPALPSLEWGDTQVRVVSIPDDPRYQIEVGEAAAVKRVQLSYKFKSIVDLSIVADRLLVLGKQSYGSAVGVIDLVEAKQLLETSCFQPVVSPDASYVAFERFSPRSTPREFNWPQVEIVDVLAQTPAVQALYPPFDAPDENLPEFHSRRVHVPISPLIWSQNSLYLIYFDKAVRAEQEDRWKDYTIDLMVFEFDKTKRTNTTKSAIVDVDGFVDHSFPKPLDEIAFGIQSLEFVDDSILEATVFPHEYLAITRFRFDIKKAIASGHLDPVPYSDGVAGN